MMTNEKLDRIAMALRWAMGLPDYYVFEDLHERVFKGMLLVGRLVVLLPEEYESLAEDAAKYRDLADS